MIYIASTASPDRFDKVYILLNSLKHTKKPETDIVYYIFTEPNAIQSLYSYIGELRSADFLVAVLDISWFNEWIHAPQKGAYHYARCLFSEYFPTSVEKILWLDIDMVFYHPGIEDLWEKDITDYLAAGVIDPTWQYCPPYHYEIANTKTDQYINTGVLLMNLDKIRRDGRDQELEYWLQHWDENVLACNVYDQTLLNYLWKGQIKLLNTKFNNSLLASLGEAKTSYTVYMNSQGYIDPLDSLQHAVILHFCGSLKPWEPMCSYMDESSYPYKKEAIELWNKLSRKYRKPYNNSTISV